MEQKELYDALKALNKKFDLKSTTDRETTCPHCGHLTKDVESGMGYIICQNCKKSFNSTHDGE